MKYNPIYEMDLNNDDNFVREILKSELEIQSD